MEGWIHIHPKYYDDADGFSVKTTLPDVLILSLLMLIVLPAMDELETRDEVIKGKEVVAVLSMLAETTL